MMSTFSTSIQHCTQELIDPKGFENEIDGKEEDKTAIILRWHDHLSGTSLRTYKKSY